VNWVDIVIIAVVGFSALLAFMRGLVREVLGIGAWLAAGFVAAWALPYVQPRFHAWISEKDIADVAGFGSLFVVSLLIFSLISGFVGGVVRTSVLGGIDRTLGMVFGLVRGAGVLALAYIVVGLAVPLDHWPEEVQEARTLPLVYQAAILAVGLLPLDYRPVVHVPPGAHETTAADLLHVNPLGRAVPPALTR
jgi:membrane protein required for colicin V production